MISSLTLRQEEAAPPPQPENYELFPNDLTGIRYDFCQLHSVLL